MKLALNNILFKAQPRNYSKVDETISRSAQPQKEDFSWLKEQGVTDVFNFRTMFDPAIDFSEKQVVEDLGMKYHNIPTISALPTKKGVDNFLDSVQKVKDNGGKAHIHCKAGADRTGMYAFIYKMLNNIGSFAENKSEWIKRGHNRKKYPNMIEWAMNYVTKKKPI